LNENNAAALDIKQGAAVLELVLDDHADGFEDELVLLDWVPKSIAKGLEALQPPPQCLLTGTGTGLELSECWWIGRA
jgi:predicted TPR repeat methyltransferase